MERAGNLFPHIVDLGVPCSSQGSGTNKTKRFAELPSQAVA
jgi:hypothetical protein